MPPLRVEPTSTHLPASFGNTQPATHSRPPRIPVYKLTTSRIQRGIQKNPICVATTTISHTQLACKSAPSLKCSKATCYRHIPGVWSWTVLYSIAYENLTTPTRTRTPEQKHGEKNKLTWLFIHRNQIICYWLLLSRIVNIWSVKLNQFISKIIYT